jgi:hypothetical protein
MEEELNTNMASPANRFSVNPPAFMFLGIFAE